MTVVLTHLKTGKYKVYIEEQYAYMAYDGYNSRWFSVKLSQPHRGFDTRESALRFIEKHKLYNSRSYHTEGDGTHSGKIERRCIGWEYITGDKLYKLFRG